MKVSLRYLWPVVKTHKIQLKAYRQGNCYNERCMEMIGDKSYDELPGQSFTVEFPIDNEAFRLNENSLKRPQLSMTQNIHCQKEGRLDDSHIWVEMFDLET